MSSYQLLGLDLRSPLAYRGLENPPLAGIPLGGSVPLPCPDGAIRAFAVGIDLVEGEEELFVFDEEGLIAFDPDEGPRLAEAMPPARFYGRAAGGAACSGCPSPCSPKAHDARGVASAGIAGPEWRLPAGRYLFLQWRPSDAAQLAEGIEWFARESWWEGNRGQGPYILRRIKEDGKLATQILRRAEVQSTEER